MDRAIVQGNGIRKPSQRELSSRGWRNFWKRGRFHAEAVRPRCVLVGFLLAGGESAPRYAGLPRASTQRRHESDVPRKEFPFASAYATG